MSTTAAAPPRPTPARRPAGARRSKHRRFDPWGVVAWIVGLGFFFPVFWMVLTAFKQEVDAYTTTPKFFFAPDPGRVPGGVRPGRRHARC